MQETKLEKQYLYFIYDSINHIKEDFVKNFNVKEDNIQHGTGSQKAQLDDHLHFGAEDMYYHFFYMTGRSGRIIITEIIEEHNP